MLIDEAGHDAGQRRRVEPVEQSLGDHLGDEQIAFMEDPDEILPFSAQRPPVEMPPFLKDLENAIEHIGQGVHP